MIRHTSSSLRLLGILGFVVIGLGAAACGTTKAEITMHEPMGAVKKVVIAQYAVEWRNIVTGHTVKMPEKVVQELISAAPKQFAEEIQNNSILQPVVHATPPEGQSGTACGRGILCPSSPKSWKLWGGEGLEMERCELDSSIAQKLAEAHGADAVLVAFSFWRLAIGFKKTAVVDTTFKLYARDGRLLASGKASGGESAGVFPAGAAAAESFAAAAKRSFHDIAVHLGRGR